MLLGLGRVVESHLLSVLPETLGVEHGQQGRCRAAEAADSRSIGRASGR